MTFGKTLRKHLTMALSKHFTVAASAIVFYIAIDYRNKTNMRVAASNVNIKIYQLFSIRRVIGVCVTIAQRKILDLTRTCS